MSRSGYSDDCENLGLWRAAVERAVSQITPTPGEVENAR
jgi:hypothetical protein